MKSKKFSTLVALKSEVIDEIVSVCVKHDLTTQESALTVVKVYHLLTQSLSESIAESILLSLFRGVVSHDREQSRRHLQ